MRLISVIISVAWVDADVGVNGFYFRYFYIFIINLRGSRVATCGVMLKDVFNRDASRHVYEKYNQLP